jgi:UrcA family protein
MNVQYCKTPPVALVITRAKVVNAIAPALLLLGTATVALTPIRTQADDFSPRSVRVSLHNLNLNSAEGARKAYGRLKEAAFGVCGESSEDIEVIVRGPGECVKETLARAVLDVQSAELSKVYIKRNGIGLATLYGVTPPIVTAGN